MPKYMLSEKYMLMPKCTHSFYIWLAKVAVRTSAPRQLRHCWSAVLVMNPTLCFVPDVF